MLLVLAVSIGIAAASALGIATVVWHFAFGSEHDNSRSLADRAFTLSAERYSNMIKLLDDSDFHFLKLQPGFTPAIEARVRSQRYRLFVAYLNGLRVEFRMVCSTLKCILAQADNDCSALSSTLLKAQLTFAWGFLVARVRAYVWQFGWGRMTDFELPHIFEELSNYLAVVIPAAPHQPWSAVDDAY